MLVAKAGFPPILDVLPELSPNEKLLFRQQFSRLLHK
jgi:hypothetical protein